MLLCNPHGTDNSITGWNDGVDDGFITLTFEEFNDNFVAYFVLKS